MVQLLGKLRQEGLALDLGLRVQPVRLYLKEEEEAAAAGARGQMWRIQGPCSSLVYTAIQANTAEHLGIQAAFASLRGREGGVLGLIALGHSRIGGSSLFFCLSVCLSWCIVFV